MNTESTALQVCLPSHITGFYLLRRYYYLFYRHVLEISNTAHVVVVVVVGYAV